MKPAKGIIKAIRPEQWIKNFFLFAGIIFGGKFFDLHALWRAGAGFGAFCALASGIYLLNDVSDIEADRNHPAKKVRPIASGAVPIWLALSFGSVLIAIGLIISFLLSWKFGVMGAGYIILQLAYTLFLKRLPILDILAVASGFVIRAAAGGIVVNVPISSWLLVCTSLIALFLVTEKRRQELARIEEKDEETTKSRPLLKNYSVAFLDQLAIIEISATIVGYMLYVFSVETRAKFGYGMGATIPFVFYGLFRYLWLVFIKKSGESPTKIFLTDFPSIINLIFWSITVFIVYYLT